VVPAHGAEAQWGSHELSPQGVTRKTHASARMSFSFMHIKSSSERLPILYSKQVGFAEFHQPNNNFECRTIFNARVKAEQDWLLEEIKKL
jgi:hypothetical protein